MPMSDHCDIRHQVEHHKEALQWCGGLLSNSTLGDTRSHTAYITGIHNTATDRRCAMLHSKHSLLKKTAPLTTLSSSLIQVRIGSRSSYCRTVILQNEQGKTLKHL